VLRLRCMRLVWAGIVCGPAAQQQQQCRHLEQLHCTCAQLPCICNDLPLHLLLFVLHVSRAVCLLRP
jgi:hypothetical protein